jgi:hypothetical protein
MDDNDLYGAGADASASEAPPADKPGDEEEPQGEPVLVNKELCEDCQPGDRLIVEVLKDHGKEIEIRYVGKEKGEESDMPPGEPPPEMAEAGGGAPSSMMD